MLMANGAQAVTYRDAADNPIFEPPLGKVLLWKHSLVTGLFDAAVDMKPVIANLEQAKVLPSPLQYKLDGLEDKDWEREWMDKFHPIQFGERLWICPSWREVPEPSAVNILLDPGMAWYVRTLRTCAYVGSIKPANGASVVDFGCGSGILGIAALMLGAKHAIGIDDRQALIATVENAARNGVADAFDVYLPSEQPPQKRASAGKRAGRASARACCCHPDYVAQGRLVMSGILERQADDVMAAYQHAIDFDPVVVDGDWVMLSGVRSLGVMA